MSQKLIPVHHGHVEIEKDEIGRAPELLKSVETIDCDFDAIPFVFQERPQEAADTRFILDHEDARPGEGHRVTCPPYTSDLVDPRLIGEAIAAAHYRVKQVVVVEDDRDVADLVQTILIALTSDPLHR